MKLGTAVGFLAVALLMGVQFMQNQFIAYQIGLEKEKIKSLESMLQQTRKHPSPEPSLPNLPRHVIFSSRRRQADLNGFEELVNFNSRVAATHLGPRVIPLLFQESNHRIRTNSAGYPFLKDMFLQAQSLVPHADTFTYFNNDILFNTSFVDTLDAIWSIANDPKVPRASRRIKSRFMMIGLRTNVFFNQTQLNNKYYTPDKFASWLKMGDVFTDKAEDFFACSKDMWDWNVVPDFVVGRIGFDNWLVHSATVHFPVISVVDASLTSPVIHLSGRAGNFQGHLRKGRDPKYNLRLIGKSLRFGTVSSSPFLSFWKRSGTIGIVRKPVLPPTRPNITNL